MGLSFPTTIITLIKPVLYFVKILKVTLLKTERDICYWRNISPFLLLGDFQQMFLTLMRRNWFYSPQDHQDIWMFYLQKNHCSHPLFPKLMMLNDELLTSIIPPLPPLPPFHNHAVAFVWAIICANVRTIYRSICIIFMWKVKYLSPFRLVLNSTPLQNCTWTALHYLRYFR